MNIETERWIVDLQSHGWPWMKGHRSKLILPVDSLTMISYMMVIRIGSLQAIIKEIKHDLHKFDLESHRWPWMKGHRSKLTSPVDSLTMISYFMSIQTKPLTLIFKELLSIFDISENGRQSAILENFKILKQRESFLDTREYHIWVSEWFIQPSQWFSQE